MDNLHTHSPTCLYARFASAEARRITSKREWHDTPEHGSWRNMAECELSDLRRQCLNRPLAFELPGKREALAGELKRNQVPVTVDRHLTTADARIKLKHLNPVINVQN